MSHRDLYYWTEKHPRFCKSAEITLISDRYWCARAADSLPNSRSRHAFILEQQLLRLAQLSRSDQVRWAPSPRPGKQFCTFFSHGTVHLCKAVHSYCNQAHLLPKGGSQEDTCKPLRCNTLFSPLSLLITDKVTGGRMGHKIRDNIGSEISLSERQSAKPSNSSLPYKQHQEASSPLKRIPPDKPVAAPALWISRLHGNRGEFICDCITFSIHGPSADQKTSDAGLLILEKRSLSKHPLSSLNLSRLVTQEAEGFQQLLAEGRGQAPSLRQPCT